MRESYFLWNALKLLIQEIIGGGRELNEGPRIIANAFSSRACIADVHHLQDAKVYLYTHFEPMEETLVSLFCLMFVEQFYKPTEVDCEIYIRSFGSINPATMDYQTDLYLRQRWKDPRLEYAVTNESLDLNDPNLVKRIWKPEVFFPNAKFADFQYVTVPNVLVRINPGGEILYMLRLKLTFSCMMRLQRYPLDSQVCHVEIGSCNLKDNKRAQPDMVQEGTREAVS
ncbi:Glycine receptor subunit alpha-3 [Nymphon striatum]|nr:Glycine receptor subunit alpha-3 [Nymphon striatum]